MIGYRPLTIPGTRPCWIYIWCNASEMAANTNIQENWAGCPPPPHTHTGLLLLNPDAYAQSRDICDHRPFRTSYKELQSTNTQPVVWNKFSDSLEGFDAFWSHWALQTLVRRCKRLQNNRWYGMSTFDKFLTQKDSPQQSHTKVRCLAGSIWELLVDQNPCWGNPTLRVACDATSQTSVLIVETKCNTGSMYLVYCVLGRFMSC